MCVGRFGSQMVTGGHMMVATGYTNVENQNFVIIHDPAQSDVGTLTYEEYVAPPNYVHWRDFHDISKL